MRVLVAAAYYEPAFEYGGPVTVIAEACRALARAGASVTVFTTTANGVRELDVPVGQPVEVGGVQTWYFPRRAPRAYFRSPAMAAALRRRVADFDVVHVHGLWCHTNLAVRSAALRAGVPYVATLHGGLDPEMMRKGWLKKQVYWAVYERQNLNAAAAVIALTEEERRQVEARKVRAPVVVVPHGLDASQYTELPPRAVLGALHRALASAPYVLFLGRLHPKKGLELLLAAFAQVLTGAPDLRLVVAGAGEAPYEAAVRDAGARLGEERVLFVGHVGGDTKRALLAHALAFCLPSRSEGLPAACLEALMCGTPVVVSRACHLSGVATERAGFVVDRTPQAIAQALAQLAADAELRVCMASRARAYALRNFESQVVAQRLLALYDQVAAYRRPH